MEQRTMEIDCQACGFRTPHTLTPHPTRAGAVEAQCLRCAELDVEAARLNAARAALVRSGQWTAEAERRAAAMGGPPLASAPGLLAGRSHGTIMVTVAGGVVSLASFMPWIEVGPLTRSGVEGGGDGLITLALGAALALSATLSHRQRQIRLAWGLLGLVALAVAGFDYIQVSKRVAQANAEFPGVASVGYGLYAVVIGAGTAIAGAFMKPNDRI